MLLPLVVALIYRGTDSDTDFWAFVFSFAITCLIGVVLRFAARSKQELRNKEGAAVVAFGWTACALFGALPYFFHSVFGNIDRNFFVEFSFCFFESMSGFTTTGATVLTQIEGISEGILFWRSFTHWLGEWGLLF